MTVVKDEYAVGVFNNAHTLGDYKDGLVGTPSLIACLSLESVRKSSALVASSRIRMSGLFIIALATEIL